MEKKGSFEETIKELEVWILRQRRRKFPKNSN